MQLLTLRTEKATATLSPYGAQVMSFTPHNQPDALWQTTPDFLATALTNGKALRGGIPVCWPWFNAHPTLPGAPAHGLARTQIWNLTHQTESTATLTLTLDGTHPAWPHKNQADLTATLTNDALTVSLTTTNLSTTPFKLTQALHTYLRVSDITATQLTGTAGLTQRHVTSGTPLPPAPEPFPFTAEVESLIHPTTSLTVTDPTLNRALTVTHTGTSETVIWNPWSEKSAKLDMPPGSYKHMLCLEAATIDHAPTLNPNQSHTLTTTIRATNL